LQIEDLFKARVFRYVSDGWITLPLAKEYAADLEITARWAFLDRICEH